MQGSRPGHVGSRSQGLLVAVALAIAWVGVELVHGVLTQPEADRVDALHRFAWALPWQVGLFVGLSVPALLLRARWSRVGLSTLVLASGVFYAARVAEGLLRREYETTDDLLGLVGLGAGALLALLVASALGRLAPRRLRTAWAPALWAGWLLLFVPALHRAAPILSLGRMPALSGLLEPGQVVFAIVASLALLVLGFTRWGGVLVAAVLAVPLATLLWRTGPTSGAAPPRAGRPDVLMVVLDTLRGDLLDADVVARGGMPNLERFWSEAVRFERAYTPGNRTMVAMPGVMTSLLPNAVGYRISKDAETLAEYLHAAGWETHGMTANPLVSASMGFDQGFDSWSDSHEWASFLVGDLRRVVGVLWPRWAYRLGVSSSRFYYRPVTEIRRRATRIATEADRPTFLYVHTMDMHGPYLPPRRLLGEGYRDADFLSYFEFLRLPPAEVRAPGPRLARQIANLRERYAAELRFTDGELGKIFDALRAAGRWDDTLVWVLSDHGESFGEAGHAGHGGWNTTTSVLHVPLAMKPPASWGIEPRALDVPVSTLDVLPTTLSLLGVPLDRAVLGTDLSPLLRGQGGARGVPVVSQSGDLRNRMLSIVRGDWQLDARIDGEGHVTETALYKIDEDPNQEVDLASSYGSIASSLERDLAHVLELERRALIRTVEPTLDDETRDRLRRLGYID